MDPVFSTKAGTLIALRDKLRGAGIAPLARFTVEAWRRDPAACRAEIGTQAGAAPWIIRSSCAREDGAAASNAGAFLSVPDVGANGLDAAIDRVIGSYGAGPPTDEILVQPMLHDVTRSGVAFSHDPNTCAPYRVINWNDGADTAAVTGGLGGRIWQQAASAPVRPDDWIARVLDLLKELLGHAKGTPIDCEFAFTREGDGERLWLLQARPLILARESESDDVQAARLSRIREKIARGMRPHPFLKGQRTVFGVMPDWNPAEIIGVRPKPLALSIYRDLVTDSIWAYQRHNYGYRNLRSFPLMPHFHGLPYIDVRLSFNSFVPADLEEGLADRLVDHYIDTLLSRPALHDKVEFEIVFSSYTLDLPERTRRLRAAGFSEADRTALADSLRRLTNRILHPKEGLWRNDAAKLDQLEFRREKLKASGADVLERIYWLLEDVKRYGTLPFAGLARAGFIAVQMLKSMVAVGVFTPSNYDAFLASVSTVSGQLAHDRAALDKNTFLARYGHLRPGTYDILSPRYDEAPHLYFEWDAPAAVPAASQSFSITLTQMRAVQELLAEHRLDSDPVALFEFLKAAIEQREHSKFLFTRSLSDALSLMAQYGESLGFEREDLAFADIAVFREIHIAASDARGVLARSIEDGRKRYEETLRTSLPPVIVDPDDVWGFEWPTTEPNFITQRQVTANVTGYGDRAALAGAIVCIPNADPGFDWIFAYPVAGLVTAWGGANSHMAIRAGELGLPAVIGAGETLFARWSAAKRLHIDCAGRRVEILA
jgi:hypothetical protein